MSISIYYAWVCACVFILGGGDCSRPRLTKGRHSQSTGPRLSLAQYLESITHTQALPLVKHELDIIMSLHIKRPLKQVYLVSCRIFSAFPFCGGSIYKYSCPPNTSGDSALVERSSTPEYIVQESDSRPQNFNAINEKQWRSQVDVQLIRFIKFTPRNSPVNMYYWRAGNKSMRKEKGSYDHSLSVGGKLCLLTCVRSLALLTSSCKNCPLLCLVIYV